jgi:hypothetical protein
VIHTHCLAARAAILRVGCQNSATVFDQDFYAVRSYSVMRLRRTDRHLIRSWERPAMGWSELAAAMGSSSVVVRASSASHPNNRIMSR